jgi:hypothetical protein
MSGRWEVKDSIAFETQGKAIGWNYYELINFNTLLTLKDYKDYTSIEYALNAVKRVQSPTELMLPVAATSESASWFYHMYAFKITGDFWNMDRAAFIYSDRADKTKPPATQNNTFVKELASAKLKNKIKYDKVYNYRVSFEEGNVVLYINGEKILSAPFPEAHHSGRVGISSRNVNIAVDKAVIKNGDKIIFEDDFDEDSIYVKVLKASVVPAGEVNH